MSTMDLLWGAGLLLALVGWIASEWGAPAVVVFTLIVAAFLWAAES